MIYSQHLPVGIFLLVVLLGVVVNPLLGRLRYRAGELMVVVAMLLVLGGVASSGMCRVLPAMLAGPAKIIPGSTELAAYVDDQGNVQLPQGPYLGLEQGRMPDLNDPQYRYVIEGYHLGFGSAEPSVVHQARVTWKDSTGSEYQALVLANAETTEGVLALDSPIGKALQGRRAGAVVDGPTGQLTVVAVQAPSIPWGAWAKALWAWTPLLVSAFVCFIAMAALVRRQWMHHERLPYPIANVITGFLEEPAPGRKLAPVYHSRAFWVAFGLAGIVLLSQGLFAYGLVPIAIPTRFPLYDSFNTAPFDKGYATWGYFELQVFFSIVGLIFFLPTDISFSLWFCFLTANVVYGVLRALGHPVEVGDVANVSMGGWMVQCLLILWVGRQYYLRLIRAAFVRDSEAEIAELRPFTWAFILSAVGLVGSMVALGAQPGLACVAALCYLGVGLVMARLVAEAGIPFMQTPMVCNVSTLIYSLTGFAMPLTALVPLTMLAQTLSADPREHLLPFAVNAEYLAEKAGVPRRRWAGLALLVVAGGALISGSVMVWLAYMGEGHQALDSWWRGGPLMGSLKPPADSIAGSSTLNLVASWQGYGVGAVITGALGIARLMWAWWPIHPIGILVIQAYPTYMIWFSFFLGWLFKALVMRYGGMSVYRTLKPAAMGLIAAEAVIAGGFLISGLIYGWFGMVPPGNPRFLPG